MTNSYPPTLHRPLLAPPGPPLTFLPPDQRRAADSCPPPVHPGQFRKRHRWPLRVVLIVLVLVGVSLPLVTARAAADRWAWPLSPRPEVVRAFDQPDSRWGAGHRGVDLLGAEDQQVRAAGAGVVTYAGLLAGRGVVAVSHGAVRTTYEPVAAVLDIGARVSAGTVLGTLTRDQSHCAPRVCLHWGAIRSGAYVNPLSLVMRSTPRLLPLGDAETVVAARQPTGSADEPGHSEGELRKAAPPGPTWSVWARGKAGSDDGRTISQGAGEASEDPAMRTLATAVSTIAPPAVGALAGAIAAGLVVRLTRRPGGGGPSPPGPPPGWPPTAVSRRVASSGGVIDLGAVRQKRRDAA
jgi:hypothetical protein